MGSEYNKYGEFRLILPTLAYQIYYTLTPFIALDDFAGKSLREIYRELINNNLNDDQFDGIMRYFEATMKELDVPENEIQAIMAMFDTPPA
jgi:hypothetical protein